MSGALKNMNLSRTSSAFLPFGKRSISSAEAKPERLSKNLSFRPAFDSSSDPETRPLTLIYGWLVAKSKHIHKYGNFYLGKGFDVLHIKIEPPQLLWPKKTQSVVQQIVEFSSERSKQPILVHGFSVGAYLFGETLNVMQDHPEKYGPLMNRIVGMIFDSPADYTGIPEGFAKAVTSIPTAQKVIERSLEGYLQLFYNQITKHYVASSDIVKENPMKAPALMLYSNNDPISTVKFNESVSDNWRNNGAQVFTKCFQDSRHVSHFHHYPVEYIAQLNLFLQTIGLIEKEYKERIRTVNS